MPKHLGKFPVCNAFFNFILFLFFCSGESAFHAMMYGFGWAKNPMVYRIDQLRKDIPITLIYGTRSWIDHTASEIIREKRVQSYVKVHVSIQLH